MLADALDTEVMVKPARRTTFIGILFVGLLALVAHDSLFHFDAEYVELKQKHYSAQRNWSIHYDQEYVYRDSPVRYQADFLAIHQIIKPESVLVSDLATSYFAAAQLPVYVVNVHRHQGQAVPHAWRSFLKSRTLCYMEFEENRDKVSVFFASSHRPDYVLVNKDGVNKHRKKDCLAFRSQILIKELPRYAKLVWEGEFLNLYSLSQQQEPLSTSTLKNGN